MAKAKKKAATAAEKQQAQADKVAAKVVAAEKAREPKAPKKKPAAKKEPAGKTLREKIVEWAHWGNKHSGQMPYTETQARGGWLHNEIGEFPIDTDCSGFATLCYKWAGAPDPNGLGYNGLGYTGTLLEHAYKLGGVSTNVADALPGDLIVYGPGTGEHVAIIIEAGVDPLTISHGQPGCLYVRVSQDGRMPQRICRYIKADK